MLTELKSRLLEVLRAVGPLLGLICLLQIAVVQAPAMLFVQFLTGSVLVIVGLVLLFLGVDLGDAAAARGAMDRAARQFGRLDGLVNVAGGFTWEKVEGGRIETWDAMFAINVRTAVNASQAALPHLLAQGSGRIVNIASIQGLANQKRVAAYAAAKGGVIALTRSMGVDYAAQNIRANCICPGGVITPMMYEALALSYPPDQIEEEIRKGGETYPMSRLAEPEEIAKVAVFLCTSESSFMTGSTVVVDGGYMAAL